jgi:N-acetylmuramoyl-L-alanine amidase
MARLAEFRALLGVVVLAVAVLTQPTAARAADGPLTGAVIAIDPGHQLGNSNPLFSSQMGQERFNGTLVKSCNTTGTATNDGFAEATFNWKVAKRLKALLESQGASVVMTRTANTRDAWGPCVWDRGQFGARNDANLMVSIHADGAPSGERGFHVIAPGRLKGWTDDIAAPSRRLARDMIAGMTAQGALPTTYLSSTLSVRTDQSTLNFSDVPTVIVEMGNMRNRRDAAAMSTSAGQQAYAEQLAAGINRYCEVRSRCR